MFFAKADAKTVRKWQNMQAYCVATVGSLYNSFDGDTDNHSNLVILEKNGNPGPGKLHLGKTARWVTKPGPHEYRHI